MTSVSLEDRLPISALNVRLAAPDGRPPPDAPSWIWDYDQPYLHGAFAPTAREYEADKLQVDGDIPDDLCGAYVMNGPSQRFEPANGRYHYYDGDAMMRAIYFRGGEASFRQRWVRTGAFVAEDIAGKAIWPGLSGPYNFALPGSPIKDNSNTDVLFYNGNLLSLWYMAGDPYQVDPLTLETHGHEKLDGRLGHTLSAHSKVDPWTGQMFFFDYGDEAPYMRYGCASATGELESSIDIELPGPRSPHDMGLSENYAVLHDLPLFHDAELLKTHGRRRIQFHSDMPARFGVLPRAGDGPVRWFECEPCYVLHIVNTWEEGDWVHQVGCRQADPTPTKDPKDAHLASMMAFRRRTHTLHRWSFNLQTGEVRETQLDDLNTEFPMVNSNFTGRPTRHAIHQLLPVPTEGSLEGQCQTFNAMIRYDLEDGSSERYDYGPGVYGSETPIAPVAGADRDTEEDAAYAVTFTTDSNDWSSHCLIFDASDISEPIARVTIPHRIAIGFHSTWVDGAQIWS
jgi:carotenoid cleavage dioxygenase-like enzyme